MELLLPVNQGASRKRRTHSDDKPTGRADALHTNSANLLPTVSRMCTSPFRDSSLAVAFKVPDYTMKQMRDAILPHCLERSALLETCSTHRLVSESFTIFATGLWVTAHECGHRSFSSSESDERHHRLGLAFGAVCPYFPGKSLMVSTVNVQVTWIGIWCFSSKTREVYASKVRRKVYELTELTEEAPLVTALVGHNYHERQSEGCGVGRYNGPAGGVNYFSFSSPLFEAKDAKYIALSELDSGLMALLLYEIAQAFE